MNYNDDYTQGHYTKGHYQTYQVAGNNLSHVERIILLYDFAINYIKQAKEAIKEENFEKRYNLINKAIAVIAGLHSCLEFSEKTDKVASALDEFYQMIDMRLLYIQCDDSLESCDKVIHDLKAMRDAWVVVGEKAAQDAVEKNNAALSIELEEEQERSVGNEEDDAVVVSTDKKETKHKEEIKFDTELHIDA